MTVGGSTPSLITGTGTYAGLALAPSTTFNITGAGGLTISVPLMNQGGNIAASSLVETGAGLLNLTASNNYTGGTIINGGTLQVGNVNALLSSVVTNNMAGGLAFTAGLGTANLGGLSGSGNIALTDLGGSAVSAERQRKQRPVHDLLRRAERQRRPE